MGNVDKEDREIPNIPSIHLVSTLKDVKDFFFLAFNFLQMDESIY